jgi:hypothetical protein
MESSNPPILCPCFFACIYTKISLWINSQKKFCACIVKPDIPEWHVPCLWILTLAVLKSEKKLFFVVFFSDRGGEGRGGGGG